MARLAQVRRHGGDSGFKEPVGMGRIPLAVGKPESPERFSELQAAEPGDPQLRIGWRIGVGSEREPGQRTLVGPPQANERDVPTGGLGLFVSIPDDDLLRLVYVLVAHSIEIVDAEDYLKVVELW